jgi:uncharacterized protein
LVVLLKNNILVVCIDANVYISAFAFNGLPAKIIDLAFDKKFILISSMHILDEVRRNLVVKLEADPISVDNFLEDIIEIATLYEADGTFKYIDHKHDNLVIETAIRGRAQILVTGDKKDLLPLKEVQGVIIEPPSAFLQRLNG